MYTERPARLPGATLWTSRGEDGPVRVVPDGCIDLMVSDGRLLVAGPDTTAKLVPAGSAWVGVRFPPGMAPALLGVPAVELVDTRPEWSEVGTVRVGPPPAADLSTRAGRVVAADFLDGLVLGWADRVGEVAPWPRRLVTLLSAGQPVRQAARELGWSARQLHRKALEAFGYGPSVLASVLRFQAALTRLGQQSLADIAVAVGYSDQPHLARETRRLAGVPMTTLLRERGLSAVR